MKKNLLLLGASVIFALAVAEVFLRIVGFNHPSFIRYDNSTGVALSPGAEGWFRTEGEAFVRINSHGMRDDREMPIAKPEGVYRIAVLGDSYAEALQVDVSKTFWRLLEDKLNACHFAPGKRVEVLNFGVSGYSTAQELITLRERVRPFAPDLVLLAFLSGNDVRDNSQAIANPGPRPFFQLRDGRLIEDTSFREHWIFKLKSSLPWQWFQAASNYLRIVALLFKAKASIQFLIEEPKKQVKEAGLDDNIYLSNPPKVWEEAWQLTQALITAIRDESVRLGARFLLVTLSNGIQVHPEPEVRDRYAAKLGETNLFYPERRMKALAQREKLEAVFLAEDFAKYASEHKIYLHGFPNTQMGAGHWNENGHRLAADLIARHLCSGV